VTSANIALSETVIYMKIINNANSLVGLDLRLMHYNPWPWAMAPGVKGANNDEGEIKVNAQALLDSSA